MSRLSRKEMKRDEVREVLSRTLLWLGAHAKHIAAALGVVALLVIVGNLILDRAGGRQDSASDALAEAIEVRTAPLASELSPGVVAPGEVFADAAERTAEARRRFEAVASDYPRSASARVARAYLAVLDYESGNPAAARTAWDELATSGGDDLLTGQVLLNLLVIDRDQGRAEDAETRLEALVDSPSSALPQDRVLYELGVTQETLGKAEESLSTFQRLIEEHPTSPLTLDATTRVAEAGGDA